MLRNGSRMLVAEGFEGSGYASSGRGRRPFSPPPPPRPPPTSCVSCLAESDGAKVEVHWITGAQNWVVPVVLEAGLSLSPAGPICVRGKLGPLTPYLPSGPFL